MATVTTPVPPPVKNDWLSGGMENPRLSPPSPGGPRKAAPVQQVIWRISKPKSIDNKLIFLLTAGIVGKCKSWTTTTAGHITGGSSNTKSARRRCSTIARWQTRRPSTASPVNSFVSFFFYYLFYG